MKTSAKLANHAGTILLAGSLLSIAAIAVQTAWSITQDRRLTLESESNNGLVAVRLLEEHASQTLLDAQRKITKLAGVLQQAASSGRINETTVRSALATSPNDNRFLTALQFVDLKGNGLVTSLDYAGFEIDFADRSYITYLLAHPEVRKDLVGRPFKRFYDSEIVMPLARNLFSQDGIHVGLVSTDINVSYFKGVYERVAKDSKATVILYHDDGFVLVRSPFDPKFVGRDISGSALPRQMRDGPVEGSIVTARALEGGNGAEQLTTYRKVAGFAVTTVLSRDLDQVLLGWRTRNIERLLFAGAAILSIGTLALFLFKHIRRLRHSEASLRESERLLRYSESKFVNLFQRSPVPLSLHRIDDDTMIEINDSFLAQFGYERAEMAGAAIANLQCWQNAAARESFIALLMRQQYADQIEVQMRHKRGFVLDCLLSARIIDAGGEKLALLSPIDVTHQRRIEREIRDANAQLEERVLQRTQSLEESNEELSTALDTLTSMQDDLLRSEKMAALGAMVAGVAHELNTPIGNSVLIASTLHGNVSAMKAELAGPKPRKSMLDTTLELSLSGSDILSRNLQRAADLIESFKQVAADQSSNHRRCFNLARTVDEVLTSLSPMYRSTAIELQVRLDPSIMMDSYPGPLGQIITNFVSNAMAHAFEGRERGIMRIEADLCDASKVELRLSDDGIGIPNENLKRVFDPFFTTKMGRGGTGLGLHIVYNLATGVLGGAVTVNSTPGAGTTLHLSLPLTAPTVQVRPLAA